MILFSGLTNFVQPTSSNLNVSYTFDFDQPQIIKIKNQNQTFHQISISNCSIYEKIKKPKIPIKPVQILLPKDTKVSSISITTSPPKQINKLLTLQISQPGIPFTKTYTSQSIEKFESSNLYPKTYFNIIGTQRFRGYSILYLNLHPVNYDHTEGIINFYQTMNVTIHLESAPASELYRGNIHDQQLVLKKINEVDKPTLASYHIPSSKNSDTSSQNIDYVIITTEEFKNYRGENDFHKLLSKRQEQGLTSTIKTVEEIYEEYSGKDNPERIRNFIRDSYLNWETNWILLAGDVEFVPVRLLWDIDGDDMYLASDVYYQCLDGSYNYDNDSFYGEEHDGVNGDIIDLTAEVFIGRASVDNYQQIEHFVNKTLTYEAYEWGLDPLLTIAESVGEYVWSGNGGWGGGYVERCIDLCTDYEHATQGISSEIYTIQRRYERDEKYNKFDLINDINTGVHLINHLGHSSPTFCMQFSSEEILNFTNTNYAFWYSQGCHPGQFQAADECISESWTVGPHGGFAAIMNTGYGYGSNDNYDGPDNRFAREFWDALSNVEEKISRLGPANQDSKEDNLWRIDDGNYMYHNYYSTTLFGDPYVQLKGMEDFRADFSWSPYFIHPNEPLIFEDKSLSAETYKWDFDDGNTSTRSNPEHKYAYEGLYNVTLRITDEENKIDRVSYPVYVNDNWPPVAVPNPKQLFTDKNTLKFQGEDSWDIDGSIVDYTWDFDDGNTSKEIAPVHTFSKDGLYDVKLTVTDDQGKQGSSLCDIRIDTHTPPVTDMIVMGVKGNNEWYTSPVQLTFHATDWSEIDHIYYRIDDGEWNNYLDPVRINSDGCYTINYYSIDSWGNTENVQSDIIKIDMSPPIIQVCLNGTKENKWFISNVAVSCNALDNTSDLKQIWYKIHNVHDAWQQYNQSFILSSEGITTFSVYATDYAGLFSPKNKTYTISIDNHPPNSTCIISGDPSLGGTINLELQSTDVGSGVKTIFYQLNNNKLNSYTTPIKINSTGSHTISYFAIDQLNHTESVNQKNITLGIKPSIHIVNPTPGLYINDDKIFQLKNSIIAFGPLTIKVYCTPDFLTMDHLQILIDDNKKYDTSFHSLSWKWDDRGFKSYQIIIKAQYIDFTNEEQLKINKFF